MNIEEIHIRELDDFFKKASVVKKKRERAVYQLGDLYIKIWVPRWTQGDITKYCLDSGYYDEKNASSLVSLVIDETGQRGYVTKSGKSVGSSWQDFIKKTTKFQRRDFMRCILCNAIPAGGIYTDLFPTNFVMCDNLSLIDFDSFNSFSFLFKKQRQPYEKFDLNAWWKPHETAVRDTNKFYGEYFSKCLGIELNFAIDSIKSIEKMLDLLDRNYDESGP